MGGFVGGILKFSKIGGFWGNSGKKWLKKQLSTTLDHNKVCLYLLSGTRYLSKMKFYHQFDEKNDEKTIIKSHQNRGVRISKVGGWGVSGGGF